MPDTPPTIAEAQDRLAEIRAHLAQHKINVEVVIPQLEQEASYLNGVIETRLALAAEAAPTDELESDESA